MFWDKISSILGESGSLSLSNRNLVETVRSVILEKTKVDIDSDDIKVLNRTVYLDRITPTERNEVFLKRDAILTEIRTRLRDQTVIDIK